MSPMQPTWNRSSGHSPRLSKRWMTLSTSRRLPSMSFSRAEASPSLAWRRRVSISSWDKIRSLDVFTPQISTFPCIICPPVYNWAAAEGTRSLRRGCLAVARQQKYFQRRTIDTKKEFVGFQQKIFGYPGRSEGFGSAYSQNSNIFTDFWREENHGGPVT